MLGDFERSPVVFRQGSDEPGDHAGLAHVARVSADNDESHGEFVVGLWSLVFGRWPFAIRKCLQHWFLAKGQRPATNDQGSTTIS
jgi:hypothetical protein